MLDCTCTRNRVRQNFATIPMWGLRAKGEPSNSVSLSAFFLCVDRLIAGAIPRKNMWISRKNLWDAQVRLKPNGSLSWTAGFKDTWRTTTQAVPLPIA